MRSVADRPALESIAIALASASIACVLELTSLRVAYLIAYAIPLVDGVGIVVALAVWRFATHDAWLFRFRSRATRVRTIGALGAAYGLIATPGLLGIAFLLTLRCPCP